MHSDIFIARPAYLYMFAEQVIKAACLTMNSNFIGAKHLWLSGNTKDMPFFCTVAFSCFVNCNDIKVKITAKDDYKPLEKLG